MYILCVVCVHNYLHIGVVCVHYYVFIHVLCVSQCTYRCCVGIGKLSGVGYCDVGPLSAFFHAYINILVMCVCILIVCMTEWYVFLVVCLYVNLMCMC